MNPQKEVGLLNKLVFKIYAERFGLPVPKFYGVFDPMFGIAADGRPLQTAAQLKDVLAAINDDFLLKPIGADRGRGIALGSYRPDGSVALVGEAPLTVEQLARRLSGSHFNLQEHVSDSWLIEERIRQHPFLDRYSADCTQTLRVVTFITKERKIVPVTTIQKIAVRGAPIDNVGDSGMAALVNHTGVLGPAYRLEKHGTARFDHHPETGARIAGERLPNFDTAVALAVRAQAAVPQMRNLAWDIAITRESAVIIEGNSYWGWEGMQRNTRHGLLHGPFGEEVRELIAKGPALLTSA